MLKLVEFFEYPDEAPITLLQLDQPTLGLEKKAAYCEIEGFCSTLSPKPGYTYLHILAMGSAEYWGHNRNCDSFPEENLRKYYKTFETTPARLYRNHINKDPAKSYGTVIFSCYNENMHRIELVVECQNELVEDINQEIRMGKFPATSMATKTPSDRCSICGNRARTRQEYCTHLRTELGRLYPDGRRVVAINDDALIFFDISKVIRPADVTSSVLVKVAHDVIQGSAELAEVEGLLDKTAELKKVSELIKEFDGTILKSIYSDDILSKTSSPPKSVIYSLKDFSLKDILLAFANLRISPSINFLSELAAHKQLGEGYEGIGDLVESYLENHPSVTDHSIPDIKPLLGEESSSDILTAALRKFKESSSLESGYVEKRASRVGYSGLGPFIEDFDEPTNPVLQPSPEIGKAHFTLGNILLGLGLTGLALKYFITSEIKNQVRGSLTRDENRDKIVLVKSAQDKSCLQLANASLLKAASTLVATTNSVPPNPSNDNSGGPPVPVAISSKLMRKFLQSKNTAFGTKLSGLLKIVSVASKLQN